MTAICGGGTSAVKPGSEAVILVTSARIAQLLENSDNPWLIPLAPLLTLPPFVLATFCSGDPPAIVALTSDEATALVQTDFTNPAFATGLTKLPAIFANLVWQDNCQCTSGAYIPPTYPTPPAGTPIQVGPSAPPTSGCQSFPIADSGAGPPCNRQFGPGSNNVSIFMMGAAPVGANITSARVSGSMPYSVAAPGPNTAFTLTFRWTPIGGGTEVDHAKSIPANQTTIDVVDAAPASTGYQLANVQINVPSGAGNLWNACWTVDLFCNGDLPTGTQQPCCPPDTATQSLLDSIYKLVTLVQRQTAPFAYVLGNDHPGLTGNGEISLQGVLGVKVTPSSIPNYAGVQIGDPDVLWLDSWITWGNADGWIDRKFLRSSPYVSLPEYAGQFTKLGYSLAPGLTVDIRELVREP